MPYSSSYELCCVSVVGVALCGACAWSHTRGLVWLVVFAFLGVSCFRGFRCLLVLRWEVLCSGPFGMPRGYPSGYLEWWSVGPWAHGPVRIPPEAVARPVGLVIRRRGRHRARFSLTVWRFAISVVLGVCVVCLCFQFVIACRGVVAVARCLFALPR